jgi:hypothetical protein
MAVIIYVSESATPTVRGKITAKTHPPCPLAAARGVSCPPIRPATVAAGSAAWPDTELANMRISSNARAW